MPVKRKTFGEIKKEIKKEYKNGKWVDSNGKRITIKKWEERNRDLRKQLKQNKVKCKGVFYNPNDGKIYIKQSFRNEKIDGLIQWTCSMEDYRIMIGEDSTYNDFYLDDEYFKVSYEKFLREI